MTIEGGLVVLTALAVGALLTHVVAERSRAKAVVWVSFWLHVLVSFVLYDAQGLLADAGGYDTIAQAYVAFWNHQTASQPGFAVGKEGWVLILAVIYYVLGHSPLVGLVLNASACAITTSLVMGATARLGRPGIAKVAGWLSLLPTFLYWGSLLLRESLAWMLTAAMLWAALGIAAKVGRANVMVLLGAFAGMLWIRGTVAVVLVVGMALGIIASTRRIPPLLFAGAVGFAVVGGPLAVRVFTLVGGFSIESLNASRASLSTAGSGFETTSYSDPVTLVQSLPRTFPRSLFGPYPWELTSLPITAVVDVVFWLFVLVLAWRGFRGIWRVRSVCVIPALCLLVTLGATSGSYGTLVRLRVQAAVLLLPLAAVGWRRVTRDQVADGSAKGGGGEQVPIRASQPTP